jgi:flagellar basal-body rod protein FlgC
MELDRAIRIAAAGMDVQSARLRVVAENLANRDTTSETAGGDPFRRKTVTFANRFNRALGANIVGVARVGTSKGDFPTRHERSYSANLSVIEVSRGMLTRTIEAMR